jgi:hypothetical protein
MADKPFGLRDIQIALYTAPGTALDVPVAGSLSFTDTPGATAELRGDDQLADIHIMQGKPVVELEAGGIALDVWAWLAGGTYSTGSGYYRLVVQGDDTRPYLVLGAQVYDNAGLKDIHLYLPKCRCTGGPKGQFKDGAFFLTGATIEGVDDGVNGMYQVRQNDTATPVNLTTFI